MPIWVPGTPLAVEAPLAIDLTNGVSTVKARTAGHLSGIKSGVTVTNTNPETSLLASTHDIGGNFLTDDDLLVITAWGTYLNNTAGTATIQFRAKAGSTVLASVLSPALAQSASNRFWKLETILRVTSASAANTVTQLAISDPGAVTDTYQRTTRGLPAVDFTQTQAFDITGDHSAADANLTVVCDAATFVLYRSAS